MILIFVRSRLVPDLETKEDRFCRSAALGRSPSLPEPGRLTCNFFWAVLASAIVAFVQLLLVSLTVCIGVAEWGGALCVARKVSPSTLGCKKVPLSRGRHRPRPYNFVFPDLRPTRT